MVDIARMFVVVAIHAKQLPVASIGRIEIVIMIAMMHGQFWQVGTRELARATPADPWIHFQRAFAITGFALCRVAPSIGDDAIEF